MSRYVECDDDSPEAVLAYGRWERNSRVALKGKRGRKALRELREALLALPEKRLIGGAVCTVGGPARVPEVTEEAITQSIAQRRARATENGYEFTSEDAEMVGHWLQEGVGSERQAIAAAIDRQGEGVCAVGAYLWHQRVKAGADPAEAFDGLPAVFDADSGDPMGETAELGRDAGLTYTLAWNLAYRNDETYRNMTPEERYTAFLAWIDAELDEPAGAVS